MTETARTRDRTRVAIVDAAARLLAEHGAAGVTTRAVAGAAGVQAPTLYRIFGDKDGLLEAVAEHVLETYVAGKRDRVAEAVAGGADPVADLRAGWRAQVDFGLANPALFTLLSDPERARRSPAVRAGHDVLAARVHRVAVAGRLRVAEERAVAMVHAAGTGAILTLLALPPAERGTDVADVADDLLEAVLREVLTDTDTDTDAGPAAEDTDADVGDPSVTAAAVALRAQAPALRGLGEAERALLAEWLDRVVSASRSGAPAAGPAAAG